MKKWLTLLCLLLSLSLFACGKKADTPATTEDNSTSGITERKEDEHPMITISVKDYGDIVLELYPEYAPITVENFIKLAESGFYKGLTFHRIYKGFMIQGGMNPNQPAASIKGEFASNGVDNPLSHERGVISMARATDPNSASSQFFICDADSTFLDGQYAAFGRVVEGLSVLDAIASTEVTRDYRGELSTPLVAPVIENITVNK